MVANENPRQLGTGGRRDAALQVTQTFDNPLQEINGYYASS
jgi:hypothetical protein